VTAGAAGPPDDLDSAVVHGSDRTSGLRTTWRLLAKELGAFGVVGAACFVLDVALFQVLYAVVGTDAVLAKLLATLVSMTAAYVGHRYWSFSHRARTGLRREYLLFAAVNGATLGLGLAIVALVRYPLGQESALVLQAANIASICLGTVIRYLSYRAWVFPAHRPEPLAPAAVVQV
jgi:putative flippase GtrA